MSCLDCFFDRSQEEEKQELPLFTEIIPLPSLTERLPDLIEVFIATVEPKFCGELLKVLPRLEELSHLKRVSRVKSTQAPNDSEVEPACKKSKHEDELHILIGPATDATSKVVHQPLIDKYNLQIHRASIPGRPADSKEELEEFNKIWPTLYFHKKTTEHKLSELELTADELALMAVGMREAIADGAAVIMDPKRNTIVSKASEELASQGSSITNNPLATPPILAIQGVSRRERQAALEKGMTSSDFRQGQYLCTGYDIFLLREPSMFESMALVHSRIRRVVFGINDAAEGGLGGSGHSLHSLAGTNHHYRVFQCSQGSELRRICISKLKQQEKREYN
jgi:tRNA-specific adenosine deaminase 3